MLSRSSRILIDPVEVEDFPSSISIQRASDSSINLFQNYNSDSDTEDDIIIPRVPANSKARITYSILFALYKEYKEYWQIKQAYPNKYNTEFSIRSIGIRNRVAKSTVHYYFKKFRTNSYFIVARFFSYRYLTLLNARKNQPKFYPSQLEEEVVEWVLRNRQEGLTISGDDLREKAAEMIKCPKTKFSRNWLYSFLRRNNLSLRVCTHRDKYQSHINIKNKIDTFHHIIGILREKFKYSNAMVINMDETPFFFDYNLTTVEEKGSQFVSKLQMGNEKRRLTCVLTAVGEGSFLRPMIIYNQKKILELEPEDYLMNPLFCWSENGWLDSDLMLVWFRRVILPYVKKKRALLVLTVIGLMCPKILKMK